MNNRIAIDYILELTFGVTGCIVELLGVVLLYTGRTTTGGMTAALAAVSDSASSVVFKLN